MGKKKKERCGIDYVGISADSKKNGEKNVRPLADLNLSRQRIVVARASHIVHWTNLIRRKLRRVCFKDKPTNLPILLPFVSLCFFHNRNLFRKTLNL